MSATAGRPQRPAWLRRLAPGRRLVLSLHEPLVEGGAAEEFERRVQVLLAEGYHDLVIDLSAVDRIDDAGIRGLVRGYTTAQRLGGSLGLTGLDDRLRAFLGTTRLDSVFTIFDSLEAARSRPWPWQAS